MTERVRRLIEYHFTENNDARMTKGTVERIVKKIADKARTSKPVSPHVLRHTFIEPLNESEWSLFSLFIISEISFSSTLEYISLHTSFFISVEKHVLSWSALFSLPQRISLGFGHRPLQEILSFRLTHLRGKVSWLVYLFYLTKNRFSFKVKYKVTLYALEQYL